MRDCPSCQNSGVNGGGDPCTRCNGKGWVPERLERRAQKFDEFQRLWAAYQNALRVPFSLDREEDARIKAEVERCFDALNRLSKEG